AHHDRTSRRRGARATRSRATCSPAGADVMAGSDNRRMAAERPVGSSKVPPGGAAARRRRRRIAVAAAARTGERWAARGAAWGEVVHAAQDRRRFDAQALRETGMKRFFLVVMLSAFAVGSAVAQETCESKAISKDGKPLAGAAKTSFLKKCKRDACA